MRGRSSCRSIRVFIYRFGWSEDHIESSTVRFPPCEEFAAILFIGEGNAAVELSFEVVIHRNRIHSAAIPKLLNELLSLFVGIQVQKRATFFRRNDVNDIFCEPITGTLRKSTNRLFCAIRLLKTGIRRFLLREEWLRAKQRKQQHSGTFCEVKERHDGTLVVRKDSLSPI